MSDDPWSFVQRASVKANIDAAAQRAAKRLGACNVLMVAFFWDGRYMHYLDGGTTPGCVTPTEVYRQLVVGRETLNNTGGKDCTIDWRTGEYEVVR